MIQISIIIINYQTWEATLNLIKLLETYKGVEIVVIDNGPDDTLKSPLKEKFPYVSYHSIEKNIGYAAGINRGVEISRGEWIMVLNNDIEAHVTDVIKLVGHALNDNCQFAAPRLIKTNGNIQDNVGCFDNCKQNLMNCIFAKPRLLDASAIEKPTKVDLATGGAVLFHRDVIKRIGKWDERFFMYFEDIDFGLRLKKAGIPVLYVPEVEFHHLKSHTANRDPKAKIKNYDKSRARYLKKHRGVLIKIINDFLNLY